MTTINLYILEVDTHLQDGHEHSLIAFSSKEKAVEYINRYLTGTNEPSEFILCEVVVRKKIPLSLEEVSEPQPAKVTRRFVEA